MTSLSETLSKRGKTHGDFATSALLSQGLKRCFRNGANWNSLNAPQKEALDVIALKLARILTGNPDQADHWHDIAGYARLVEIVILKGEQEDESDQ